ncbi:CDC27 family protein [Ekhidna sp. To15]|uniref:CDC27 family protein n=1 Tax=Ekhidna sp. To15 TaxID=3395267 RepID=UPI003F524EBF
MEEIERIRAYITNELSPKEKADFEADMDNDAELREAVEKEHMMMKGIAFAERDRLKNMLQKDSARSKYWYVAAALIPLLIISYFFFSDSSSPQSIYTDYYEPYGVYEFGEVRGGDVSNDLEREAFSAYQNGEYNEAYDLMLQLQSENNQAGYNLYAGICLIELGKYKEALDELNQISESSKYFKISLWYRALIHIKLGQINNAKEILSIVTSQDDGLGAKSRDILDQL